jgi:hypothetical protein
MANYETELEQELEQELHELHEGEVEGEEEAGLEGEGILGAIGNVLGGLLGEGEEEGEIGMHELHETHELPELEEELTGEGEAGLEGEGILGTIGNVLGGLLGEGEIEGELEGEVEGEFETGEQFFGKIARGIGGLVKRAAPILKRVAKVAAPMVGTAIGGPFGAILGQVASSALGEGELQELPEGEEEFEGESEMAHEIGSHELTQHEALAEMMAEAASQEQHEGEAEAMAGASVVTVISPADRRALRRVLPHLIRGAAILTRILRRRRITRPAVRAVPTIMRRTIRSVKRQAAAGTPITRKTVARAAATQVRRVLGSPRACTAAITRNLRVSRAMKRSRRRAVRG